MILGKIFVFKRDIKTKGRLHWQHQFNIAMKKGLVILFAAVLGLSACNKFEKGEGDMTYKIYKNEGKPKIAEGDLVKFNVIQMIDTKDGDSTLVNTYDNERPPFFTVTKSKFKGDLVAALKLLGEGDSASFKLNLDSLAKYNDQPKPLAAQNNYATITVKIEKVLHKVANETDSVFEDKKRAFYKAEYEGLVKRNKENESAKIATYIADNDLKMNTTPSGLSYLIERPGNAERAAPSDTILVDYTGEFTNKKADGKLNVFDTSNARIAKDAGIYSPSAQYAARPLVLNQLPVGFAEGIKLIGVGGKIKLIIPSKLGYGENGGGSINPFTPLVFDVELKSIIKPNNGISSVPLSR